MGQELRRRFYLSLIFSLMALAITVLLGVLSILEAGFSGAGSPWLQVVLLGPNRLSVWVGPVLGRAGPILVWGFAVLLQWLVIAWILFAMVDRTVSKWLEPAIPTAADCGERMGATKDAERPTPDEPRR